MFQLPNFDSGEVTLLSFDEFPLPPYSARRITETFEPDWEPNQRRTWNGRLRNLTPAQMRWLRITIACSDTELPALEVIPTGTPLTVNCATYFARAASTGGENARDAVPGSEFVEDGVAKYRPRLFTQVESFQYSFDEYGAVSGWTLVLREIGGDVSVTL